MQWWGYTSSPSIRHVNVFIYTKVILWSPLETLASPCFLKEFTIDRVYLSACISVSNSIQKENSRAVIKPKSFFKSILLYLLRVRQKLEAILRAHTCKRNKQWEKTPLVQRNSYLTAVISKANLSKPWTKSFCQYSYLV